MSTSRQHTGFLSSPLFLSSEVRFHNQMAGVLRKVPENKMTMRPRSQVQGRKKGLTSSASFRSIFFRSPVCGSFAGRKLNAQRKFIAFSVWTVVSTRRLLSNVAQVDMGLTMEVTARCFPGHIRCDTKHVNVAWTPDQEYKTYSSCTKHEIISKRGSVYTGFGTKL